jgi:decaprenyl-phosphate phosphoribosyltransferase
VSTVSATGGLALGLVRTARPRQWTKNVLVLAAPLAAGVLLETTVLLAVAGTFVAFCLSASGVYLVNDALDVEADRAHSRKRHRPVASGVVPVPAALSTGAVLLVAGGLVGAAVDPQVALVLVVYAVLQVAYCVWLKHQAVLDIAVVSSGFLLRAVAGAAAAEVPPSQWFLLVAAFGSLFMVAGKRYAELQQGESTGTTRRALAGYSASYLRFVWGMAASVVVLTYCLWAFEIAGAPSAWATLSIAPFVLALLRYAVDIDSGGAGEPEEIVLGDRVLQCLGLVWLVMLSLSVHYR